METVKDYKTIPYTRILASLSVIDDISLKVNSGDIERIFDDVHSLRENILYMLSGEKTINGDKYKHTLPFLRLNTSE